MVEDEDPDIKCEEGVRRPVYGTCISLWYNFCYQNPALWKELRGTWKLKTENASLCLHIVS